MIRWHPAQNPRYSTDWVFIAFARHCDKRKMIHSKIEDYKRRGWRAVVVEEPMPGVLLMAPGINPVADYIEEHHGSLL